MNAAWALLALLSSPAATADAGQPHVVIDDAVIYHIGMTLRCPVCQGASIADSPAQMAQDMMAIVRRMRAEGKSRDEIYAYFRERYGDWVLLAPRCEGWNMSLWLLPLTAFLIGAAAVIYKLARPGAAPSPEAPEGDAALLIALRREVEH